MAIVKKGTLTVTTGGVAQSLNLGFVPNYFLMENRTKIIANTNGVQKAEWWGDMASASAYIWTMTSGAPVLTYTSTNGFTPLFNGVVPVGANSAIGYEYVPLTGLPSGAVNTSLTITGISKATNASITATHAFTSADIGVTTVGFHGVNGMNQINTLTGVIQSVTSTTSFTVNINTVGFSTWTSGGVANVITGAPPSTTTGFQIYNTPLYNTSFQGLTLGTTVMVTTADVWQYLAILDAPFTSA